MQCPRRGSHGTANPSGWLPGLAEVALDLHDGYFDKLAPTLTHATVFANRKCERSATALSHGEPDLRPLGYSGPAMRPCSKGVGEDGACR